MNPDPRLPKCVYFHRSETRVTSSAQPLSWRCPLPSPKAYVLQSMASMQFQASEDFINQGKGSPRRLSACRWTLPRCSDFRPSSYPGQSLQGKIKNKRPEWFQKSCTHILIFFSRPCWSSGCSAPLDIMLSRSESHRIVLLNAHARFVPDHPPPILFLISS